MVHKLKVGVVFHEIVNVVKTVVVLTLITKSYKTRLKMSVILLLVFGKVLNDWSKGSRIN